MATSRCIDMAFPKVGVVDFVGFCCFVSNSSKTTLTLASSSLRQLTKINIRVVCGMKCQVMDNIIGKWSELNPHSLCQTVFNAMLERARLMSGEFLQDSINLVLTFLVEHYMIRVVYFTFNEVS